MRSGVSEGPLSGGWLRGGRGRGFRRPAASSHRTTHCVRQQLAADLVEIGEREHGLCSGQVLGQTAIPDLGEAPQLLEDAKGVLAAATTNPGFHLTRVTRSD